MNKKSKNKITILGFFITGIVIGIIGSLVFLGKNESPYLKYPDRLGDVVAALFVMGTQEFDSHTAEKWAEYIGVPPKSAPLWSGIFLEHPEFFRTSEENKVSLVWRRARNRVWDTKTRKEISQEELKNWSVDEIQNRLSREPLSAEETTKLIEIAINLQTQSIARREELRWFVPFLVGIVGLFIGKIFK